MRSAIRKVGAAGMALATLFGVLAVVAPVAEASTGYTTFGTYHYNTTTFTYTACQDHGATVAGTTSYTVHVRVLRNTAPPPSSAVGSDAHFDNGILDHATTAWSSDWTEHYTMAPVKWGPFSSPLFYLGAYVNDPGHGVVGVQRVWYRFPLDLIQCPAGV